MVVNSNSMNWIRVDPASATVGPTLLFGRIVRYGPLHFLLYCVEHMELSRTLHPLGNAARDLEHEDTDQ
jgi:hypothetical protein